MKSRILLLLLAVWFVTLRQAEAIPTKHDASFVATAYAQRGITRSGLPAAPGRVAADPEVLPLGTRIRVSNAGPYSGTYTVADTGSKVRGRHIDIFIGSRRLAIQFGRRLVRVTVLRWGDGSVSG